MFRVRAPGFNKRGFVVGLIRLVLIFDEVSDQVVGLRTGSVITAAYLDEVGTRRDVSRCPQTIVGRSAAIVPADGQDSLLTPGIDTHHIDFEIEIIRYVVQVHEHGSATAEVETKPILIEGIGVVRRAVPGVFPQDVFRVRASGFNKRGLLIGLVRLVFALDEVKADPNGLASIIISRPLQDNDHGTSGRINRQRLRWEANINTTRLTRYGSKRAIALALENLNSKLTIPAGLVDDDGAGNVQMDIVF